MAANKSVVTNSEIAELLADSEGLKRFYRFTAQNSHITLHDAIQITITRPKATICFSFEEWNAMGRRITQGRKAIKYIDDDGYTQFVFDVNDTHGDTRYKRLIYPMKRLLEGLDELNGSSPDKSFKDDYSQIYYSVGKYLSDNGYFSDDKQRNTLLNEGIAYSLYCTTGFPKSAGIQLHGLPYSLMENTELFKEVYIITSGLHQDIENAYVDRQDKIEVINDTDEETISDEPILPAEQPKEPDNANHNFVETPVETEFKPQGNTPYEKYMSVQDKYPDSVVVMRLGDFYEVMGDKARTVAEELDLTLTGRNVGLKERIPMCGFPYHITDKYIEKILEKHSVAVVDGDEEIKYIISHAEARGEQPQALREELIEITDENDEDVFSDNSEQHETEITESEIFDENEQDELDNEPYDDEDEEESEEVDIPQPKGKGQKGIQERKRKDKPQPTLFDYFLPEEKSPKEKLIEHDLKRGSGFEHGKFRIYDFYQTNPTEDEFAKFLRKEYGEGGSYTAYSQNHNAKGITLNYVDKDNPENSILVNLKWKDVAVRIADLIDDNEYLTDKEKEQYAHIQQLRTERLNAKTDEEKLKVIARQAIDEGTQRTWNAKYEIQPHKFEESAKFVREHKAELEAILLEEKEIKTIHPTNFPYADNILVEFYPQYCPRITEEEIEQTHTENKTINRFKELTEEGKAFFNSYQQRAMRTPTNSLWNEVQQCRTIANGVYEVSAARHGGVMISAELAPHILSPEALNKGVRDGGYYCYEEDADAAIPLRELYDKGILKDTDDYFTHHRVRSENPQIGFIPFNEATESEKATFIEEWNGLINRSLGSWNPKYWEARKQAEESTIALTPELQKINQIVDRIVKEGTENTSEGNWIVYFDEFGEDEDFVREHDDEIATLLEKRKEVADVMITLDGFDTVYYLDFCPNSEQRPDENNEQTKVQETDKISVGDRFVYGKREVTVKEINGLYPNQVVIEYEQQSGELSYTVEKNIDSDELLKNGIRVKDDTAENTDLNGILDQSTLGGAKARFRNNVKAIELVNHLYAQKRNPTTDEKRILASYVGWGGLAQAFDERNADWSKEYAELKRVLSPEDYDRAKASVLNSHYTSKEVIDGIYTALNRFGVRGNNRILEPAMGTGNFFGYMPTEISDGARLYGVELDNLTGKIASKLYPQANVQIKGFEDTTFSNDSFDIVVGNVPFGGYSVYDSEYAKYNFYIHDYFLAKGIDKLKSGGIMAVVTSKGTMDKINPSIRKYLAERAELLGAIRLPNTAFKQTAGTEVITDILFFKKRDEKISVTSENTEWLSTGKTEEGFEINNYFINHPEMVLGTLARETGLYGAEGVTVKLEGKSLQEALTEAISHLPEEIYQNPEYAEESEQETEVDYNVKPLCYKAENGRLYMRVGNQMVEQPIPKMPKDAYERISGMIALRNELHHVLDIQIQGCSDEVLEREQRALNDKYDRFVKRYGILNGQTNTKLFKEDGDSALLFACENLSEDKKSATKADIFSKRTIRPYSAPTQTDDCFEALQISKNERGKVDISYIEELTRKDYDTVLFELGDAVFRNPMTISEDDKYSGFETAEEYLSGNVVTKLSFAKSYVAQHPEMGCDKNVEALEKVQPTPLTASEISVRLGASWIGKEYYKQFITELLQIPRYYAEDGIDLFYNPHDSSWRLDKNQMVRHYAGRQATSVYGTARADAFRLLEDSLNLRPTTIYDTIEEDGKEKRIVNEAETVMAREKQNAIQEEFKNWLFKMPERRDDLERKYNALFNQVRLPTYDGSYLKFPEMNPTIELRPHQKNAVHRIITSPQSTLLHHVVGSGKTYTMAASVMKLRQYGLAKKPMIVVPNHILQQFSNEFRNLYPNANILMATKEDLEKDNRKKFVSRVAMGDWDAVIIAQSSFAKIPISQERQIAKIESEIANIEACIEQQWSENGFPRGAVKNLEKIKRSREKQLKELLSNDKKDNVLTFENLGVDYLFVDEADCYKNLFLFTKMNNVAGISSAASQRASDLQLKCEYLQELHGSDKGVVFATGTPISNSMTEMYTMQTYLQPSVLKEKGLEFFDNWAADFGDTITALEMAPSGKGYKQRTRFAKFTNLPELLTMYRSFADVQTSDMVKLNVPEAERNTVTLKPSEIVVGLAEEIARRAERIHDGGVDPHIDNMLKVTSDGKKLALDPRLYEPMSQDNEGSKLNKCAENIFEIWKDTATERGTQLVFCDLSTPKKAYEDYEYGKDFDVYNDLKYKLVQMGIPEHEIAYIHEANTDKQKQALFDKVNAGTVRVLIGSTEKCGAGTNVQKRIKALHHLDTPYRPRDLTQREGRAIRQGNTFDKVKIFTYVTERTFDSYSYQILENKQRFISQIDRGDLTVREAEDIDDRTLTYAEIKAITAANPKIKRKMEVDMEISKLRLLEGQYRKNLYAMQDAIRLFYPEKLRQQNQNLERIIADKKLLAENYHKDNFSINVNGTVYTEKSEGGTALMDALFSHKLETVVAEYGGFKIRLNPMDSLDNERSITLSGTGEYTMNIGDSAIGNIQRLEHFMSEFSAREDKVRERIAQLERDFATAKQEVEKPFEYKDKLAALLKEQAELNAELDLNKREEVIIGDTDDEDEKTSNGDNDVYKSIPSQSNRRIRPKPRKHLNGVAVAAYKKFHESEPNAYIFISNGSGYDLVGEKAKEIAQEKNLTVINEIVGNEEYPVVPVTVEETDRLIALLVSRGKTAQIIEPEQQIKEDELILNIPDEQTMDLLPDYNVPDERIEYNGKELLAVRHYTADALGKLGVKSIKTDDNKYGIKPEVWYEALKQQEVKEYLLTRLQIANAAAKVANEDLSFVDEQFTVEFIENNFRETRAINRVLGKEQVDFEQTKKYVPDLIKEFTLRIDGEYLGKYGMTAEDIRKGIVSHISNETLKVAAENYINNGSIETAELTQMQFIDFLNVGLSEIKWLNGAIEGFDKDDISDIIDDLKPHFEGSAFDESSDEVPFDEWYDEFAESTLKPELQERCRGDYSSVTKQGYEVKALYSDGMREHAIIYRDTIKDYAICYGYNRESGDWAQGQYDFKDFKTAEKNLYERYSVLGIYFRPENEPQPFATETKQGYDIEGMYSDGERNYAIIRRRKDYVIGIGYDNKTGEFEQGRYGFADYNEAETYLDKIATTEKDNTFIPNEPKNFMEIVRASVEEEYKAFYEYELTRSKEELIATDNYKIRFYNELSVFLGDNIKDNLEEEHFEALAAEAPHILSSLYDYFLDGESESINTYSDTATLIENYNDTYHADIIYNDISKDATAVCYGIDENDTVYYFLPFLSNDKLTDIEVEASKYVVASPETYLTNDELDENRITFLKIGRDIQESELKDMNNAVANMRTAVKMVERKKKIPPIYYGDWEHAKNDDEREEYRLSQKAGIDCRKAIEKAIKEHFDGSWLDTSFTDELIEKYGIDRISYVCATTIIEKDFDGRFSRDNKEWAKSIRISDEAHVRSALELTTHPAVLDGFVSSFRKKIKEIEEKKEINMPENEQPKKNWLTIKVSHNALIKDYENRKFMRMPSNSKYAGYAYNIFNNRIKEGRQLVDLQSEGHELCYEITLPEDTTIRLVKKDADDIELTAQQFKEIVNGTANKDYEVESSAEGRQWLDISVPQEAVRGEYEKSTLFAMPNNSAFAGGVFYMPTSMVSEDTSRQDGGLIIHIPEDFSITVKNRNDDSESSLVGSQLHDIINDTSAEDYERIQSGEQSEYTPEADGEGWWHVSVDKAAKILSYENQTMFRMPNESTYSGGVYYIANNLIRENEQKGTFALSIPPEYTINVKFNDGRDTVSLDGGDFVAEVHGKGADSYASQFRAPSEEMVKRFEAVERNLRKNVPPEMLERPNWVVVRTRENADTGRLDKFLINVKTGKFAESNNPETWTDFDTACQYAKENGGVALAYALDGKDKIACIDIDGCMQENGDFSEIAQKAFNTANGSYTEKSVSGKGLHIFGKTDGMDLRSFSKDGDMEYYRKAHFIAMTGDSYGSSELKSFDTAEMKSLLESKFDKRTAWHGEGAGIEGLSKMDDREVLDKAFASRSGSDIKRLYNGEDIKHNHSNSDMALINHLAFWCNGDKEQMLRIFATSGLYRPEKSADYYECTLIKAIKGNTARYQPKKESAPHNNNKTTPKASGGGNSK